MWTQIPVYREKQKSKFKVSKVISNHPAVQECNDGDAGSFDYKYDVLLKPGFTFKRGRMEGSREGRFHTVQDFLDVIK